MSKSKIKKRLPKPQPKNEQKADGTSVRPAIAKPLVIGSQSPPMSLDGAIKEGYTIKNRAGGYPFPNSFSDCEWEEVS